MANWRPAEKEPDSIHSALHDYLRTRAAKGFLDGKTGVQALGRADVIMANGKALAIDLSTAAADIAQVGNRSVIIYTVTGQAAEAQSGYQVSGRVILDRATLAFLEIHVDPKPL